jgi:hypothetical protein
MKKWEPLSCQSEGCEEITKIHKSNLFADGYYTECEKHGWRCSLKTHLYNYEFWMRTRYEIFNPYEGERENVLRTKRD